MIYFFSSCYRELFRQNVLDISCFPTGHVIRLRYAEEYLSATLRKDRQWCNLKGKDAVIVYAEGAITNRTGAPRDYVFLPLRRATIRCVQMIAGIFIVDVELEEFFYYGGTTATLGGTWDKECKQHADRPFPKGLNATEGSYVYDGPDLQTAHDCEPEAAWRSLVERLNQSELKDCITYHVRGFYRHNMWPLRVWWPERRLQPKITGPDAIYQFRSGETVMLKILFFGEANAAATGKALQVRFDTRAFTSASLSTIPINSRYTEERILLPCVRGTDPTLSTISVGQLGDTTTIWAPQPSFIASVSPSGRYVFGVAVLIALSFLVVNVGALSDYRVLWDGTLQTDPLGVANKMTKPFAAILLLAGTWFYLRKFPLK